MMRSALSTRCSSPLSVTSWPRTVRRTSYCDSIVRRCSSFRPRRARWFTSGGRMTRRVACVASVNDLRHPLVSRISCGTRPLDDLDSKIPELTAIDRSGRISQRARALLGLRKRNDLTDGVVPGQRGCQPIESEGDAAHRRGAKLQRVKQEAEAGPRLFLAKADQAEDLLLY